tara:strand:+ start:293 stop:580 length:288 start_codon:yes stop_codon:yes gene_type:complete
MVDLGTNPDKDYWSSDEENLLEIETKEMQPSEFKVQKTDKSVFDEVDANTKEVNNMKLCTTDAKTQNIDTCDIDAVDVDAKEEVARVNITVQYDN